MGFHLPTSLGVCEHWKLSFLAVNTFLGMKMNVAGINVVTIVLLHKFAFTTEVGGGSRPLWLRHCLLWSIGMLILKIV